MGDRISIQFADDTTKSPVLFAHWQGQQLLDDANLYIGKLKNEVAHNDGVQPLDRLEPQTVMVDFIRSYTKNLDRVSNDLYLGVDENDGDNSDNGHFVLNLEKAKTVYQE